MRRTSLNPYLKVSPMGRALSASLTLVSLGVLESCHRDEVTAPHAASRIAFVSDRDRRAGDIYVMSADGSAPTRLTNTVTQLTGAFSNTEPSWSPDGTRIAFTNAHRVFATELDINIWLMNADGSAQRS
ncbi:MAG TPA: hypothetical protein VM716_13300 [Gemmatimonadales bacterium]|nr:hypothetical protein [Gemmatimonadales bacterium]